MALGAAPRGVVAMVLRRVAVLVVLRRRDRRRREPVGVTLRRYAALRPRSRAIPLTFAGAAVVLCAIGALAGWIPAGRASRIDPARVLRDG